MSTQIVAADLFGAVHDITRQTPIPPATTVQVNVLHLHEQVGGQVQIHGGDQTFLSTVLDRFGSPRYLGDDVQGATRQVRVSTWDTATDTDPTPAHLRGGITITHFEREVPA